MNNPSEATNNPSEASIVRRQDKQSSDQRVVVCWGRASASRGRASARGTGGVW